MRFLVTIALLFAACDGGGAAVDVRWLIVDLTTGSLAKPNDPAISHPDNGSCGVDQPDASPLSSWRIEQVRLVLANPVTGAELLEDGGSKQLLFNCDQREAITAFALPSGTFALSLRAVNGGQDDPTVVTPAPSVRLLKSGEVVNLDVQELGIHPVPMAAFDGGVPDLASPDAGPVP